MKHSGQSLFITVALAFFVLATSLTSQASGPTFKAKKLKVTVVPASGMGGLKPKITVTGAIPNGDVTIKIGGWASGLNYTADSKGKVVAKDNTIDGQVGDKIKIEAEDFSSGNPPFPKGKATYTITGVKRSNSVLHSPRVRSGSTTNYPNRRQ